MGPIQPPGRRPDVRSCELEGRAGRARPRRAHGERALRPSFHGELDDVRSTIARLTSDIAAHVECATQTFLSEDMDGADRIIARDPENQATCADVEERCYRLLALQAPVACDLRAIIAALWIIAEVGRCGELAGNVCRTARHVHGPSLPPPICELVVEMAGRCASLVRDAGDAYVANDPGRIEQLRADDATLDALQREFIAAAIESSDLVDLPTAVQLARLARFYERTGDHAVAIGERVTYVVTATVPPRTRR
jgi:phosphate transport system protein